MVIYEEDQCDQLAPAWAITVHKAQGTKEVTSQSRRCDLRVFASPNSGEGWCDQLAASWAITVHKGQGARSMRLHHVIYHVLYVPFSPG